MSALTGALAVIVCAYLSAVYLSADARSAGDDTLVARFRARALAAGIAAGAIAAVGLGVLYADAPALASGLAHRGLPLVIISLAAGVTTLALPYRGQHGPVRAGDLFCRLPGLVPAVMKRRCRRRRRFRTDAPPGE